MTDWRAELLKLTPGIPTWLNGVPVTRIPCAGEWFRVGVHEDYPDVTKQTLRLPDALSRVRSGYFPRLPNAPGLNAYIGRLQEEHRVARNAELEEEEGDAQREPEATNRTG